MLAALMRCGALRLRRGGVVATMKPWNLLRHLAASVHTTSEPRHPGSSRGGLALHMKANRPAPKLLQGR